MRKISIFILILLLITAVNVSAAEKDNNNLVAKFEATAEVIKDYGEAINITGFCQINDKIYYIARSEKEDYVTSNFTNNLYVIENGETKDLGNIWDSVNFKEGEVLVYVTLLGVRDKMILVTNARLFVFNFETNRFEYLDWQADEDIFQDAISSIDVSLKLLNYTYYKYEDVKDQIAKDIGFIKNAFTANGLLYLQIDSRPGGQWHAGKENAIMYVDVDYPIYREMLGRQQFETDWLTIDKQSNYYVRESAGHSGKLRVFSWAYYAQTWLKTYFDASADVLDIFDGIPATREEMEATLVPDRTELMYHAPFFYGDKLLAQTKEGLTYFDVNKMSSQANKANFWLIKSNGVSFKDEGHPETDVHILAWYTGQDKNIYVVTGGVRFRTSHAYERIIKIIPPSDWEL